MQIFVLFDRQVRVVVGYFLLKKISKYPYTKGREIWVTVPKNIESHPAKKESRYDKLDCRYENGAIVFSVPENIREFDYRIIPFDRDRDTAIQRALDMLYH